MEGVLKKSEIETGKTDRVALEKNLQKRTGKLQWEKEVVFKTRRRDRPDRKTGAKGKD